MTPTLYRTAASLTSALAISLLLAFSPAEAQENAVGTWHGILETPAGPLTVVFRIAQGADGALTGEAESPDQAPGQGPPLGEVQATDSRLSFSIPRWSASFDGLWRGADGTWDGHFVQGLRLPLVLRKGEPPRKPTVEGMDGAWEGTLVRNGVPLRLVLRLRTGEEGTVVTLDSPDMGALGLPVTDFARDGDAVDFKVPVAGVHFRGTVGPDASELAGSWRRNGEPDAEVRFVRTSKSPDRTEPDRPQTPRPPFPYRSVDVRFGNPWAEGVELAGTLTLPNGAGPFPGAVLISGSGPQDRDETIWGHKPFAVLADHLTRRGVAVLRYDDRGFGASTGAYGSATSADFATDAAAAARFLAGRPEIDADAIGLVGHSEGGMIAPIAASRHQGVAYLVLLAAPGTDTKELRRSQSRAMRSSQGASEAQLDVTEPLLDRLAEASAAAPDRATAEAAVRDLLTPATLQALGLPESRKEPLVAELTSEWMHYFLNYDPPEFLARIRVPVLALNGSLDIQVPPAENLEAISRALSHNPDVTVLELEGLNHMFQTARTGAIGEIGDITETFAPEALDIVSDWITKRFGGRSAE